MFLETLMTGFAASFVLILVLGHVLVVKALVSPPKAT
jgi:hypothetical protein